ncbi:hypothetical protein DB32_001312 [Sandaracinus amylolyticus]|uniref:Uncharacterized protein n=2 Tax=Sandaracinus amylolyticus TaxID=927083 RepID=A0A0F6YFY1_9BACT|nr:hypothetical protein DB32_001312 [Sandaracinus amylolyticus]
MLVDSGPMQQGPDAGPTGVDSGTIPGSDAGPGSDSGPRIDAPLGCPPGAARCEGEVAVTCEDGVELRDDCTARDAYCDEGTCVERVCEPGSRACSPDRRSVLECDARGSAQTTTPCALFCDATSATCLLEGGACEGLPTIAVGDTERFSLCSEDDDDTHAASGDCGTSRADAGDRTFALTITEDRFYVIDLRDVDGTRGVDTVVYLRRTCDDGDTQVACDDDVPCTESDPTIGGCASGVQVRQSRIAQRLSPGTYYVVADAFEYDGFGCGTVELRVRAP